MRRSLTRFAGRLAVLALAAIAATTPTVTNAAIDASNVATLQVKWTFPLPAGVTSQPVLANGLLYATAWNGFLYALDPDDGTVEWSFNTGSGGILGVQSTPLITPAGDVCVGDSMAHVWCRDGLTGGPVWDASVGNPAVDHVWSALATANGRLFASVASHSDNPCTQGRLVALDLADGDPLWEFQTVPDKICTTDTAIVCTADIDCPVGPSRCDGGTNAGDVCSANSDCTGVGTCATCVTALGAGVTATVSFDPTGNFVYMNTVGCYTFPSVGDSDSIIKLDAATGLPVWKTRVDAPEQFGACSNDPAIDCGTDAACGAVNTCVTKTFYHDYGFLNGPIPVDVGAPVNATLLISGSKNGTLYAVRETDGMIEWSNVVEPKPVTPAFAGFGLFNGPLAVVDGRVHAALYDFVPALNPDPEHLQAFDVTDGSTLWTDEIGLAWSGIGHANGLVFAGTNTSPEFRAYNAATGQRLAQFLLPAFSSSVATVDGEFLYVGFGIFGAVGGVRAYELPPPPNLEKCQRTVNKETAKFLQASAKALSKCEIGKIKGSITGNPVCRRQDANTVQQLVKAESKKMTKIAKACGGDDQLCGGDLDEEVGGDRVGFGAACPGFEGRGQCTGGTNDGDVCSGDSDCTGGGTCVTCDGAIDPDTCTDVTTCVDCIAAVATHQLDDLLSIDLVATDPSTQQDENECQQTIQKEVWKFYSAKSKILQKCWDKALLGKHGGVCPDAAAAAGTEPRKAADQIAKAESKKIAQICKQCGGDDQLCNGAGDIPLASIYSPLPTCPAVTLPGPPFTDCGAITLTTMDDLVDCLDCVAEFKIDCTAVNQVPSLASYPSECQ